MLEEIGRHAIDARGRVGMDERSRVGHETRHERLRRRRRQGQPICRDEVVDHFAGR